MDKKTLTDAIDYILAAGFVICKGAEMPDNETTMNAVCSLEEVVEGVEDSIEDLNQTD